MSHPEKLKRIRDGEYAICPHCGYKHGDCWEWVRDIPKTAKCDGCGKLFTVEADYSVDYVSYVTGEEKY